jgi:hypothetical protein
VNLTDLKYGNVYDAVEVSDGGFVTPWGSTGTRPGQASLRMFGNANVGMSELTNLQIPGQLAYDRSFVVQRWYARNNFPDHPPELRDLFKRWANSVTVRLDVGSHPEWQLSLYELTERRPRTMAEEVTVYAPTDPFPVVIPVRQNFSVGLDQFGHSIEEFLPNLRRTSDSFRPRIWIHLEGVILSPERNMNGDFSKTASRAIELLFREGKKRRTSEEQIVSWLGGLVDDERVSADTKGHVNVIRDAIIEGKHRG